jgi:hypothetical protein
MRRVMVLIILLGVVFGVPSAAIVTSRSYPGPLVLLVSAAAPLSLMYPCVALARLGWRLRRHRRLRPFIRGGEVTAWLPPDHFRRPGYRTFFNGRMSVNSCWSCSVAGLWPL